MKRVVMVFVLLDNALTNLFKRPFKTRWRLEGKCRQCGRCCREIYLKITPAQLKGPLFKNIAVRWLSWLFDFKLLAEDHVHNYLIFSCRNLTAEGKCGNYFWRPNVCRNYPLVDYFEEPKTLPACGFSAVRATVAGS